MEPKVSVIMPSLNVKDYIYESIKSVIDQSIPDIEIICVDAHSQDGTYEILTSFERQDRRIRVFQIEEKSYGKQVNYGIQQARGEYIAIVETDDYIEGDMLSDLYNLAEEHKCDYVKSDYDAYYTQNNGERFFLARSTFLDLSLYDKEIHPRDVSAISTDDWYLWQGIYKRSFIVGNDIKFNETKGAAFQDIGFLYQITRYADKGFYTRKRHYKYCIDRDNASSNAGKGLMYSYQEFKCLYDKYIPESDYRMNVHYYGRMAKSFVCCLYEIAEKGTTIDSSQIDEYYNWFKDKLQKAIEDELINEGNIHDGIWVKLMELLESKEGAYTTIRCRDESIRQRIGEIDSSHVVIFGCGNHGYGAYKWIEKNGYHLEAFMDNNSELWGKTLNGVLIKNPVEAPLMGNLTKFIVANEKYWKDIKKQLIRSGVLEENIIIYS